MLTLYRVHFSVYPLGVSEPSRVLLAVRAAWVNPPWQQTREIGGAWFVEGAAESPMRENELPEQFALRLSMAVWRNVGRFVKVVVDVSPNDGGENQRFEWLQADYAKLMPIR